MLSDYNGWPSSDEQVLPVDFITVDHRRLIVEMCSDPEENPNPAMPDLPLVLTDQMVRDAVAECTVELPPPIRSTGIHGYAGVLKVSGKYKGFMYMMGKKAYRSNNYDTPLEAAKWYTVAVHLRDTRWCVKETKSVREIDTLTATPIPSNLRFDTTLRQVRSEGYVRVEEGGNHDLTVEQLRDSDIVMGHSSSKDHIGTKIFREKLESMQTEYTSGGGKGRLCSKVVCNYVNDLINGPKKVRFMERYLDNDKNIVYGAVGIMSDVSNFWSHLITGICESLKKKKKKQKTTKKTGMKKTGMDDDDDLSDDESDEDYEFKPKSKKRKK